MGRHSVVAGVLVLAAACTSSAPPTTPTRPGGPELVARPCPVAGDLDCATLTVPLDHTGQVDGTLDLAVAMTPNADAPRGTLLFLAGGPGQPGVATLPRVLDRYLSPEVQAAYRVVMFDQRGTGEGAIDCPELQASVGGSDYLTPPREATTACAERIGSAREHYSSDDVVADIDLLREALGVSSMVVDGVSYGTFTGSQYARTYPQHVSRLVLDSPVPQDGFEPLGTTTMRATARVLRDACADQGCATDPAADLAWVLRNTDVHGPDLVEALSITSVYSVDPTFGQVPEALASARTGDDSDLQQILQRYTFSGAAPEELSAGLHMATLCTDLRFPWGDSSAPVEGRESDLRAALDRLPDHALWPYDRATAAALLAIEGCVVWPPTEPTHYPDGTLTARTLILSGEHDLFCPLEWARQQLAQTPRGQLRVIPSGGHGVQPAADGIARDAVTAFLLTP